MFVYAYVPALTTIALLAFIVTLNLRKMIDNFSTSIILLVGIFGIIWLDSVAMEYWITGVSTSKLFLPCIDEGHEYEAYESFFDLSIWMRASIKYVTGKPVPSPIMTEL